MDSAALAAVSAIGVLVQKSALLCLGSSWARLLHAQCRSEAGEEGGRV